MKVRNSAIPASYLILRKNNKVLLMLRQNTGYCDGLYAVPAGHIEAGELPIDALKRESLEEIGLELEREHIKHVHTMYRTKHNETGDRVDYFFEVRAWKGEPQNIESHKCDHLRWFSLDALPENVMPHVRRVLTDILNGVQYSELSLFDIQKMEASHNLT